MRNIILKVKRLILFSGDVAVLYFSLWVTLAVRYWKPVNLELWNKHLLPFTAIFLVWLMIFFINKLYDLSIARNNVKFYSLLINSLVWCTVIGFIFFYLTTSGISPKTVLILDVTFFGVLVSLWRRIFNRLILSKRLLERIVIIGLTEETIKLAKEINEKPQFGFKVTGIIQLTGLDFGQFESEDIDIITRQDKIRKYISDNKIKTVVMAMEAVDSPQVVNELYKSLNLKMNILDLPSFAEKFTGKILINTIGQMWFLENVQEGNKQGYELLTRVMDILLSSILLLLTAIFIPCIYAIIKINSKGRGFFMQQRTGKDGKKFMAVKFRTMYENSEKNGPQWAVKEDSRITGVGKFLRKTRIDEIPQLINVLRGEMSFMGPRPERPEFISKLKEKIPFYETRLLIKPGITGWAQINFPYGASEEDALEKLQYDLYYIKNRSLILDLSILLKTIKTVLSGGGQ
ncbi:MAG: sugar transferase [Candidatus Kuenenbacteria bacterium]